MLDLLFERYRPGAHGEDQVENQPTNKRSLHYIPTSMRIFSACRLQAGRAVLSKRRFNPFELPSPASAPAPHDDYQQSSRPVDRDVSRDNLLPSSEAQENDLTNILDRESQIQTESSIFENAPDDGDGDGEDGDTQLLHFAKNKKSGIPISGRNRTLNNLKRDVNSQYAKLARTNAAALSWNRRQGAMTFEDLRDRAKAAPSRLSSLATFLSLHELAQEHTPGMELNLADLTLSVSKTFPHRLVYAHDPDHHAGKPWIADALLRRAESWNEKDMYDFLRLLHPGGTKQNSMNKQHRGQCLSNYKVLFDVANRSLKRKDNARSIIEELRIDHLGVTPPPSITALQDGMYPEDVVAAVEHVRDPRRGPDRRITAFWVSINAPFRLAMRSCLALSRGYTPAQESDILTPTLLNFGKWLRQWHTGSKDQSLEGRSATKSVRFPGTGVNMCPDVDTLGPIPIIFAFRQKYIWFTWHGGFHGKLVAQYASHWLPVHSAGLGRDWDTASEMQQRVLLQGPPAGAEDAELSTRRLSPTGGFGDHGMVQLTPLLRDETWDWKTPMS
ncbi:hypothetical protein BD289DRAFT_108361 [Coniella lustricola]|uniref:Uncharacterized protein n=1 Tax=Coniella lustricola TaxID=2025994 RepID=A0A2T3AGL4_9PEZI|nr:hypothetical protein BD289DRAFT_108361 [Coniella lustricola]